MHARCSGEVDLVGEASGFITDGSGDYNYGANQLCSWIIHAPRVIFIEGAQQQKQQQQ